MKGMPKTILSLVLIILFMGACLFASIFIFIASWLHTFKAFTAKTPVAEVTLSEIKQDDLGPYIEVEVEQFKAKSALSSLFVNETEEEQVDESGTTEKYKLYGDVVHLGGPIVKFKDTLILLNFKTVYKLGKLYARYDIDNDLERSRTPEMQSTYDLNGGIGSWKSIHDDLVADNLKGDFYNLFIDTTQISAPGIYATNKELTYTLYITNTGFLWDLKED